MSQLSVCISWLPIRLTYPTPSCTDDLGVGGKGFLEGGRFRTPASDEERLKGLDGRDPKELKRRTATSFSVYL